MFTRITAASLRRCATPALFVCALALAGCSTLDEDDAGVVAQTSTTVDQAEIPAGDDGADGGESGSSTTVEAGGADGDDADGVDGADGDADAADGTNDVDGADGDEADGAVVDPDEIDDGDVNGDGEVAAGERENLPVTGPNDILIATVFGLLLLLGGRTVLDAESAIRRRLARRHAVMPPR